MSDLATLQTRLAEAKDAKHKILTGRREVSVGYGDKQTTFNRTNLGELKAYIAELETEIAQLSGSPGRRPIYMVN